MNAIGSAAFLYTRENNCLGLCALSLTSAASCSSGSSSKGHWIPIYLSKLPICLTVANLTDKSCRTMFFNSASILLKQTLLLGCICTLGFTLGLSLSLIHAIMIRFHPFCNKNVPHHNRGVAVTHCEAPCRCMGLAESKLFSSCVLQSAHHPMRWSNGNIIWAPCALTPKCLFPAALCTVLTHVVF